MRQSVSVRSKKASSLVETVCGSIILIAVALFLVDVAAMVICQTQNDSLAKHCALAAAAQTSVNAAGVVNPAAATAAAQNAVNDVITQFNTQNGSSNLCVYQSSNLNYDTVAATAYVKTVVKCFFPVPIPLGPSSMSFQSDAYEPITAQLP